MKVRAIRPWDLSRLISTTAGHRQRVSSRGSALFKLVLFCFIAMVCATTLVVNASSQSRRIGDERAIPRHLQDGEEFQLTTNQLIAFGRQLFTAMWTTEDGAGRPLSKGTGAPLSDPQSPLIFPRNFNRVSGPDTNSC